MASLGFGRALTSLGGRIREDRLMEEERARQEELDRLRREQLERGNAQEDFRTQLALLQAGGGLGEAPTVDVQAPQYEIPEPTMPGLGLQTERATPLAPVGLGEEGMGLRAPAPSPERIPEPTEFDMLSRAKADPDWDRYATIETPAGKGHVERPRWREDRERSAEAAALAERRAAIEGLPHIPEPSRGALLAGLPPSIALPPAEEPDVFAGSPRFPNTPEGRQARLDYERQLADARRAPEGEGPGVNWQRVTDGEGLMWWVNPRTQESKPLLGPGGEQMKGRVPDNPNIINLPDGTSIDLEDPAGTGGDEDEPPPVALPPLSDEAKEEARTDPAARAWYIEQGYDPALWGG